MKKIESKIVGYKVVHPQEVTGTIGHITEADALLRKSLIEPPVVRELKRPLVCNSKTYKLKPPQAEHALYVTISSIKQDGKRYPFELFFNTKNPNHIEWTSALTLTISIAFRTAIETGSSLSGLIDNLKETFGTSGSYISKIPNKPKFVNGLVAEIGLVIEEFNNECLAWNAHSDNHAVWETEEEKEAVSSLEEPAAKVNFPCPECGEGMRISEGCLVCLCGFSKCG